ncbi:hypothetical protein ZHAS_00000608 [Anopheles sinensis]|uniref:Uncharacterized protein n=1 Tax=Anopheles sinensis TaxID=74873 RepID=A0A084VAC9_ANOSI|nr:hypothetical protein ZHAS_00000608 [Anopheles sinensis]
MLWRTGLSSLMEVYRNRLPRKPHGQQKQHPREGIDIVPDRFRHASWVILLCACYESPQHSRHPRSRLAAIDTALRTPD